MEQVVTHYGETIQEHSVDWYKKQLSKDFSVQFIKDSLLPQLFEWSNAYKAAVELTNKKPSQANGGSNGTSSYALRRNHSAT